jgi:hypothetical protein
MKGKTGMGMGEKEKADPSIPPLKCHMLKGNEHGTNEATNKYGYQWNIADGKRKKKWGLGVGVGNSGKGIMTFSHFI